MDPLRPLQPPIDVEEIELVLRGREAVVRVPGVAHDGPLVPFEHLLHDILATARRDPIDHRLEVGEHPHPPVLAADPEGGLVPVDHGDGAHLFLEALVERPERLGGLPLHLEHGRGAHDDPVALSQAVDDLRDAQPEHPKVDNSGHEREPEGTVPRVGRWGLDTTVTSGTGVARDLHIEDERLGRREVGDRSPTDLERLPERVSHSHRTGPSEGGGEASWGWGARASVPRGLPGRPSAAAREVGRVVDRTPDSKGSLRPRRSDRRRRGRGRRP